MLSRTISISVGSVLLISLGVCIVSCDDSRRYEMMKFLFDGVEPPESQKFADGPVNPNLRAPAQEPQGPIWYVHEPRKDCTLCHGKRGQRRPTAKAFLISPVPQLCYDCHDDPTASAPNVHGPVAVGQCLFCHSPHKSQVKYLLKGPVPELCYLCHDTDAIQSIPAHIVREPSACTDCHDPHASSESPLLKEGARRLGGDVNRVAMIGTAMQDYVRVPGQSETAQMAAYDSNDLDQVLWTVSKLVEQGELRKAGVYLEQFKDSQAFTDQERQRIAQVLDMMYRAVGGPAEDVQEPREQKPANEQKPASRPEQDDPELRRRRQEIADIYYASMDSYRDGKLVQAREGLLTVLKSGLIPQAMGKTIRGYISDIDKRLVERTKPPDSQR